MQCPVCQIILVTEDAREINTHIDECLTTQFLAEQARSPAPRPLGDADEVEGMNLDEQVALEMARSGAGDAMMGYEMYRDTFKCPYPGCASRLEAQELPSHAATNHSTCLQTIACPICEHETGVSYEPDENTNLLRHLQNAHGDLAEMYQALMMSRSMYIEHINKPVELPKEVGKSSLVQTLRDKVPDQECQICLLDFCKGDQVTWMDCFCVFHEDCIETWFKKVNHRECPVHKDN